MKLYLVHGVMRQDSATETFSKWVGNQADCATARKEYVEQGAKRADINTSEIEVPTHKAGLLAFLNEGQHA